MNRDTAVSLLKGRLKRASDTALDTTIISEMQFVQGTVLEGAINLPWFLLSENQTASTTIDEERISLPVGFLREYEEGALWVQNDDGTWKELIKDDYDALANRFTTNGKPRYYALDGEYFRLKPTPDAVYALKIRAYVADSVLSTNIENQWLLYATDLLIAETGFIMASRYLRDEPAAQTFRFEADSARTRLFIFDEARKHANRSYQMGDD